MSHHKVLLQPNSLAMLEFLKARICGQVLTTVESLILQDDYAFYIVEQNRGRCYMQKKEITLPKFCFTRASGKLEGYASWYVAHECSHAIAYRDWKHAEHGQPFMEVLKTLCPKEFLHFETSYKPRNAFASGISKHSNGEVLKVGKRAYDVDLGDLL